MNKKINLEYINNRIKNEFCKKTKNKLSDEKLLDKYKKCKSVINKIKNLGNILDKYNVEKKNSILDDFILELIPPGTKGVIRGNRFNNIIKKNIKNMNLDKDRFKIGFEKKCPKVKTTEIPDWYIYEKQTNKVIIGMNQLDLWTGGQQLNRGSKYLLDSKLNTENTKLLCVVCNKVKITNKNNKVYKLFKEGFKNDTLCYIKNLENIIINFFN